jgi:hypothetical protein
MHLWLNSNGPSMRAMHLRYPHSRNHTAAAAIPSRLFVVVLFPVLASANTDGVQGMRKPLIAVADGVQGMRKPLVA